MDLILDEVFPVGQLIGTPIAILVLSWICVSLRLFVKLKIVHVFSIDDTFIFIAAILFTLSNVLLYVAAVLGFGDEDDIVPLPDVLRCLQFLLTQEILYLLTTIFIKLSLAFLFLKLVVKRPHRIFVIATATFYTITSIVYIILAIFQCSPVQYFWLRDLNDGGGVCVDPMVLLILVYVQTGISTATDFAFALLPIAILWGIQMSKRTKCSVCCVLCLGIFSASVNIIRFKYVSILAASDNITSNIPNVLIFPMISWSFVEVGVSIMATSLATIRPLLRLILRAFDTTWTNHAPSEAPLEDPSITSDPHPDSKV